MAQCVEAAGHEYDPITQKSLLRVRTTASYPEWPPAVSAAVCSSLHQAASFGKSFQTDSSPDRFVATCRELRVLNSVRDSSVGLPLTHTQYPRTSDYTHTQTQ